MGSENLTDPVPMDTTSGGGDGFKRSMENYRSRDPYYDHIKSAKVTEEELSSVLYYTFVPFKQMLDSIKKWPTKPTGFIKWNEYMEWKGRGNIWRALYVSPEIAKEVISKGAFKVDELHFVPKGMRSERRKGGVKKHYDKRLKTKVWRVDSWWFVLDKKDIQGLFEAEWSKGKVVIKTINQRVEGGLQMAS